MVGSLKTPSQWDSENSPTKVSALASIPNVEITVAGEDTNSNIVTVQVIDGQGMALAQQLAFLAWLSDTAGAAPTATAPDADVAINAAGIILLEHTTDIVFELLTDADGLLDLDIGETSADTWYLNIRLPGGAIVSSAAISFT